MKLNILNRCPLLACGFVLLAQNAFPSSWTTSASVCQPGTDSAGTYAFNGAQFLFAASKTGQIKARCHITNPKDSTMPTWNTLEVGYVDPDGNGASYQIEAELFRENQSTGLSYSVATFDSNLVSASGPGARSITFSHTFDFDNNGYFVTITVNRADSNKNPAVWFIQLK